VWVVLVTSLILLPRLGSYGFWEPAEMDIASQALPPSEAEQAEKKALEDERAKKQEEAWRKLEARSGAAALEKAKADKVKADEAQAARDAAKKSKTPLRRAMVEAGVDTFGVSEFGARFPFFVLALLAAVATYFLALRVRGPTAGAFAVVILLASPLFVFQARMLNGQLGALAGGTLMLLAAVGLCSATKERRASWLYGIDALLLFAGSGLGYYSSGFLVGFLAPLGAIAIALVVSAIDDRDAEDGKRGRQLTIAAGVGLMIFLGALYYFVGEVFEWVDAKDDEFSIFGKTMHAGKEYSKVLAGTWKQEGNLTINFNSLFEQIAFGLFPWVCLAPIAVARMGMGAERGSNALGARMLFTWAAAAWLISSLALRKMGPVQYAAVPAVAVAVGVWLDELLAARKEADETLEPSVYARLAPPLIALFALLAIAVISKDIKSFPAKFLSLHLDKAIAKFPAGVSMHKALMVQGILFGLCISAGLFFLHSKKAGSLPQRVASFAGRWGIPGALGLSLVLSLFLAQIWTPRMSTKLSSKATFGVYHELREEGNILGIVGKASSGAKFYARGAFEALRGRSELVKFLQRPERVFASVKAAELCPIHKEANKQDFDYYVVDDSNAERVILSNRMWNDDVPVPRKLDSLMRDYLDRNPLWRYIVRQKPQGIQHPLKVNYDDKLELIGIDVPSKIDRGDHFDVTLYYHVLKPMTRNWQVFVHFDGGDVRFQGDHYPVKKRCGTNYWQPGDYIIDTFTVESSDMGIAKRNYKIWTGLFVGSSGNWENMKVVSPKPDNNNRVQVGSLRMN
jgi:hypothetical protein